MSSQEVSVYRHRVQTGDCRSELNGSWDQFNSKAIWMWTLSQVRSEIDQSQKQINRVVCCVGWGEIKAIGMWTLECRRNWDRSKGVTLFQSKQISWIDLRTIQLGSKAIHKSELDQSEIDLNVNAQMWTEIDLNVKAQMWTEIDLRIDRSECERSNVNWDRSKNRSIWMWTLKGELRLI